MSVTKTARRYADSLLSVALEAKLAEKILADCKLIVETTNSSRELVVFLKSPIIKSDKKSAVLKELFGFKIQTITSTFIDIIVKKNRVDILGAIVKQYIEAYNEHAGIIQIKVESASDLSTSDISSLKKALEVKTGKKVELATSVKTELLGGMTVKIKDTVIDGSVKHKLESLNALFTKSAI